MPDTMPRTSERRVRREFADRNDELFRRRAAIKAELDALGDADGRPAHRTRSRLTRQLDEVTGQIVSGNQALVENYVNRFAKRMSESEREELVAAGIAGLMKAVEGFDPDQSSFASWAYRPVQRSVISAVHQMEYNYLSLGDFEVRPQILRAAEQLREQGRPVTVDAVAAESGARVQQVERVLHARSSLSLNRPVSDAHGDEGAALEELLAGDTPDDPVDDLVHHSRVAVLTERILPQLEPRELETLRRHWGLDGGERESLAALAAERGTSREAARQVAKRAIAKLEHPVALRHLARS
jgi:RNA polymerase sigma factor (sigma-70 family)